MASLNSVEMFSGSGFLPSHLMCFSLLELSFASSGAISAFFEAVEECFELNEISEANRFQTAFACIRGKAETWGKLTVNPEPLAIYKQMKDVILLAFPSANIK